MNIKLLIQTIEKDIENMTIEERNAEYESLTHENFYKRWVDKIHKLPSEIRISIITKIKEKYKSDKYRDREYKLGYEPREELFTLLFHYATCYSKDILEIQINKGDILDFCNGLFLVDDTYIVSLLCGQGSVIHVYTKDEYNTYQNYLKSINNKF